MKMSNVALALSGVVFGGVLLSSHASAAEGRLVVYCSAQKYDVRARNHGF